MPKEIERKFLVLGTSWKQSGEGRPYRQGYLSVDSNRNVRIRVAGDRAFITVKGKAVGIERSEFEYEIPVDDANEMLDGMCLKPLIEKIRYRISFEGRIWEVDEFLGDNLGLVVAEVELSHANERVAAPSWVGKEVSDDPRYLNASLVTHPFNTW